MISLVSVKEIIPEYLSRSVPEPVIYSARLINISLYAQHLIILETQIDVHFIEFVWEEYMYKQVTHIYISQLASPWGRPWGREDCKKGSNLYDFPQELWETRLCSVGLISSDPWREQILGASDCFAFFSHPEKIGKERDCSPTSRRLCTDNVMNSPYPHGRRWGSLWYVKTWQPTRRGRVLLNNFHGCVLPSYRNTLSISVQKLLFSNIYNSCTYWKIHVQILQNYFVYFLFFFYLKTLIPRICRSNNFVIRHSPDHDAIHVLLYITMTGWTSKSIYFIIHIFLVIIIFLVATFYKFVCRCNLFSVPFNNMQTHAAFKQWLRFLLLPIILDILADISGNRS